MITHTSSIIPYIVIGLILLVGLVIMFLQPYWAFLLSLFLLFALPIGAVGSTRIEGSAFFNLGDACMLIAILACLLVRKRSFLFPMPALAMLVVLLIGLLTSIFTLGLTYGVMRAFRSALNIPILYIITANMIQEEDKIKPLILTLIIATVCAEIQHLIFITTHISLAAQDVDAVRTGQFYVVSVEIWLMAGLFLVANRIPRFWLQLSIGGLFAIGALSLQGRSLAFAFAAGLLIYYLWFLKGPNAFRWQRFKGLLYLGLIGGILALALGFSILIRGYTERLSMTFDKRLTSAQQGVHHRSEMYRVQFNDWLKGNILIGRGLNYFEMYSSYKSKDRSFIDWGGMYAGYLVQLGLIGFLVYAIWFPLAILLRAKRIFQQPHLPPTVVHLAILTGACFIYQPISFIFSGTYLARQLLPGILAGAIWGLPLTQPEKHPLPAQDALATNLPISNYQIESNP